MLNSQKFTTAEERAVKFEEWCESNHMHGGTGSCVRDSDCHACHFEWLDLEAEKEKPLPCPFCGKNVYPYDFEGISYVCKCGYHSQVKNLIDEAISAHNRMARAVGAGQKEEK